MSSEALPVQDRMASTTGRSWASLSNGAVVHRSPLWPIHSMWARRSRCAFGLPDLAHHFTMGWRGLRPCRSDTGMRCCRCGVLLRCCTHRRQAWWLLACYGVRCIYSQPWSSSTCRSCGAQELVRTSLLHRAGRQPPYYRGPCCKERTIVQHDKSLCLQAWE